MLVILRPFFRYYGGKWRAAPKYPPPQHSRIVEPFAGSAGYSLRYHSLDVTLIEKYSVLAGMWDYLIHASPSEIRSVPDVEHVDEIPERFPPAVRHLVGFWLNAATVSPRSSLSSGTRKLAAMGRKLEGWNIEVKERLANQVEHIRHWKIIHDDYTTLDGDWQDTPTLSATWFIDPPYNNRAGSCYIENEIDYYSLSLWCQTRLGQVIVCENEGANWLPFEPFATLKPGVNGKGSREVVWHQQESPL